MAHVTPASSRPVRGLVAALAAVVTLAAPGLAAADPPAFEPRARTAHFVFYGADRVANSVDRVAAEAEERYARICAGLGGCPTHERPIDVWVAEDPERFASAFPGETPMAEWAAGVAFIGARRVVLRAHGSALFTLLETFDHEIAHILLHEVAGGRPIPRWLSEGLAIWLSGEDLIARLDSAQRAAITGNLIPLAQLDRGFPDRGSRVALAYAQSALFTRHLIGLEGGTALPAVLRRVGAGERFEDAFAARFGASASALAETWSAELEDSTSAFILLHDGSILWIAMTLLFIYVGVRQRRNRLAAIEGMDDPLDAPLDAPLAAIDGDARAAFDELASRREAGEAPTLH